jgi:NAD(P)-dependent dehydrogenase (short-subunit alcohol dehydrogenase family)
MSFANKVVMITGAGGSLGRAVAETFARSGARLALVDVSKDVLQKAYPVDDAQRLLLGTNLLDATATMAAVEATMKQFGRLDILCNIAGGFAMGSPVHVTTAADWQAMQDINVGTLLNAVRAAVPRMLVVGGGKIVNVGAGAGQKGLAHMGAYSASKSAVIRITEAMAGELREQNINVNCVLPSVIDTAPNRAAMPDVDPKKWVAPRDLANVIAYLCSEDARAIHGAALPVVGLS